MTLATRCTACGTVFRIVRDQLRVSDGWVRCGRCQEVFNALDNLFDLEREAPPPWTPPPAPEPEPAPSAVSSEQASVMAEGTTEAAGTEGVDQEISDFADARYPSSWPAETDDDVPSPMEASGFKPKSTSGKRRGGGASKDRDRSKKAADPVVMNVELSPEFVRKAERAARWRRPQARIALSIVALVLMALLAGQMTYHFRDWMAALWPDMQPSLQAFCARLGCQIEPVRRIDSVSVESSGISRVNGIDAYKLAVTLRNRSGIPVAVPTIDLTLSDPQGQLIARRALAPAEMGATQNVLAAGTEMPLQVVLATGERRVFGYTVDIFYP